MPPLYSTVSHRSPTPRNIATVAADEGQTCAEDPWSVTSRVSRSLLTLSRNLDCLLDGQLWASIATTGDIMRRRRTISRRKKFNAYSEIQKRQGTSALNNYNRVLIKQMATRG